MTPRLALLVAALAGVVLGSSASVAGVRSEVDSRKVGMQDQVRLTITVEGPTLPDQLAPPALTHLRVAGGPAVSTSMSFINGRSSQSRSWTWSLQPTAIGRGEIGAVQVGDESAPPIAVDIVAGRVRPPDPQRRADPFEDPFRALGRPGELRLLVEAKPSRTTLYVGEPLLLTYYLYTQTQVSGLQFEDAPQYTGFWAEDVKGPERPTGEPTNVEGVNYHRFPVMMKLLYPTKAGRLTIPASTLSIGIPRQSFFDAGGAVQRSTEAVTVTVKPIPDEPGFGGAVGRFTTTATLDRPKVGLGEAATLRFKVEGSGNLKWIDRGPEPSVPGAKVYPPQVKSNLETKPTGIQGSRTWEYVVVPQTGGTIEIPALAFSWFDPATSKIVRSETRPLPLEVEGGAPGAMAPSPASGAGLAARGGPLPLRADPEWRSMGGVLPGSVVGLVAVAALLAHGALAFGSRIELRRRPGPGGAAPRNVRGALADLQRIGRGGLSKEAAAGLIEKTIHGVFGADDGADSERSRAVRQLLDDVHAVRYAPQLGDYSERLRQLAARAGEVVRRWA